MKFLLTTLTTLAAAPALVQAQVSLLQTVVDTDILSTLETAAGLAGAPVTDPLSNEALTLTAFAPTNDAFTAANLTTYLDPPYILHLQDLLLYHVTSGQVLSTALPNDGDSAVLTMLNTAGDTLTVANDAGAVTVTDTQSATYTVVLPDVAATNGVAHVIDGVLLPTWAGLGVAGIAQTVDRFSTLVAAAQAAGLVTALETTMGITVFAPNNDAFAAAATALGFASVTELAAQTELLTTVLQYHVIAVVAPSASLTDGMMVETLNGESLTINVSDKVTVNTMIEVITPDILTRNGIIHEINGVLVPPSLTTPTPAPTMEETMEETSWATLGSAALLAGSGAMMAAGMVL